jgi:hypothetical protein
MKHEPTKARLSVRAAPPPTRKEILAKALEALGAKRITGEEATQVEVALNAGVVPQKEVLERIFEQPLGKSLGGWQRVIGHCAPFVDAGATFDPDRALLDASPDFISLGGLFKATRPVEDGGQRTLFFEASNEDLDHQNEIILQRALADSADYYLRHGNVDLSHWSLLGPRAGIANPLAYEIGRPLEVHVDGTRTFVKAVLYRGDSAQARNANLVWDSLTRQFPPATYFPSVGGSVLEKSVKLDPATGGKVAVVTKVRWSNVALDRCPVNKTVPQISTVPVGTFAKSLGGFVIAKSLEAGYGTDSATLTGGNAVRVQSLDGTGTGTAKRIRAQTKAALAARRITGTEASAIEAALNANLMPTQELLARVLGRPR